MLPELLDQIPADQVIGSVTADGAYDTRKCHKASGPGAVAAMQPLSSSKSRRGEDELFQAARAAPHGPRLRSQIAEIQIRIVGLNRYTTLGCPITTPVA